MGYLQDILNGMHVTTRTDNRIQLESSTHQAAVRLTWDNERKTWLLTAFEKKETSEPANSRTDVVSDHNGKPDDTATRQDSDVSSDKDTQSSETNNTYTIEPAQYVTKRGKVLDMFLVKFPEPLTKERQQAAKEIAKSEKSWYDHKESARKLAETTTGNDEALRDALAERLQEAGIEVVTDSHAAQQMLDEANGNVKLNAKKKKAPETDSVPDEELQRTAISSANGAKILKNLDDLIDRYEKNQETKEKTFLGTVAAALGINMPDKSSKYATFEAMNGKVFSLRLSNHNAKVSNFDNYGESEGISIVISSQKNKGAVNDGNAHVVEFFYNAIKLRRADGKPLVEILKSIKQALYSGEYMDTTGLADVKEANPATPIHYHRVYHGSGAEFSAFDHSHMGEGEGAQAYGWGSYVTEVKGIGRTYAESQRKTLDDIDDIVKSGMDEWDSDMDNVIETDDETRERFGVYEPVYLEDKYRIGDADEKELALAAAEYYGEEIDTADEEAVYGMTERLLDDMLDGVNPLLVEEQSIVNHAKAGNTYMKAPNGKPTNLSPRQWAAVRTAGFKDKYGDWEKVARIEKLRNSKPIDIEYNGEYDLNRDTAKKWLKENIRGLYTNADTNEQIEISKVGINEVTAHGSQDIAHLKSLSSIPKMIENSIYINEIPNAKENDKYDSYKYYVCGLNIDGDDYTAKIVVGVKGDRKYYDHRLTQIEKGNLINNLNGLSNSVAENQNAHVSDIKDKRLVSILQNNYTGRLDENGAESNSKCNIKSNF